MANDGGLKYNHYLCHRNKKTIKIMNYRKIMVGALLFEVAFAVALVTILFETNRIHCKLNEIKTELDSTNVKVDSLQKEVYLLNCYLYD